jgi:uncharacterized protein with PIN domain
VPGLGIRLYIDEDVFGNLARALRRHGYDAESCQEAGRAAQEIPDEEQLAYATLHGRAILSFNRTDFLALDARWKRAGLQHLGIVISVQVRDFGEFQRRVERHLNTYCPAIQNDTLLWLDPTPTR